MLVIILCQGFIALTYALTASTHSDLFSEAPPLQKPLDHRQHASSSIVSGDISFDHKLNDHALLNLHKTLVSIPSTSGQEHAVARFLKRYLQSLKLEIELQSVAPLSTTSTSSSPKKHKEHEKQRFNVLAHPPGSRQTPLLLTSHIDTVPPHIPYSLHSNDEIWGRGTVDAKACVATQLHAYLQLVHSRAIEPEDASFLFVVGEEIGGDGMLAANDLGLHWETVIFGEPTELKLASGHKGVLNFDLKAEGSGVQHSGYPELGESAIDMLLPALMKLKTVELPKSEKYGNTTVNIGRIVAGVASNVMAKHAEASIGIRIAGGDPQDVQKVVLDTVKGVDKRIEVKWRGATYGPIDIDHDVPGFEETTVNYGTDIPNLKGDHKRYLYGPGSILVAHSDHEHLRVQDLYNAVEGYKKLILHALDK